MLPMEKTVYSEPSCTEIMIKAEGLLCLSTTLDREDLSEDNWYEL